MVFIVKDYYYNYFYYLLAFASGQIFCKYQETITTKTKILTILIYLVTVFSSPFIANKMFFLAFKQIIIYTGIIVFFYLSSLIKENKILTIIGDYSFYIYLIHEPIILKSIFKVFSLLHLTANYLVIPFVVLLTVFTSVITYKIIMKFNLGKFLFDK